MSASILPKLEASRKELLDPGLRNLLINYKRPKSKGLQITDEKSAAIFELLVKQGKAMSFLGRAEPIGQEMQFAEPAPDELEIAYTVSRLPGVRIFPEASQRYQHGRRRFLQAEGTFKGLLQSSCICFAAIFLTYFISLLLLIKSKG